MARSIQWWQILKMTPWEAECHSAADCQKHIIFCQSESPYQVFITSEMFRSFPISSLWQQLQHTSLCLTQKADRFETFEGPSRPSKLTKFINSTIKIIAGHLFYYEINTNVGEWSIRSKKFWPTLFSCNSSFRAYQHKENVSDIENN